MNLQGYFHAPVDLNGPELVFQLNVSRTRLVKFLSASLIAIGFPWASQAQPLNSAATLNAETVANYLSGLLIFERQDGLQIHMTTCTVQQKHRSLPPNASEVLLYQEQASHTKLDQPYRQRFLRVRNINDNQVISETFRPKDTKPWVQFCQKPRSNRFFSQVELESSHCTVILHQTRQAIVGETQRNGCPSQFRGATSVHNRIILTSTGMRTYDRGLNEKGQVVWGSRGKPYIFTKAETTSLDSPVQP